jgi:hypothetical protein
MSWVKYFAKVTVPNQRVAVESGKDRATAGSSAKYSSYLPEVYAGHPNRIQRYYQYDDMDRDSDIHSALDTIADFCTQSEEQNDQPFDITYYGEDATETEVKILKAALNKWTRLNNFRSKLWNIFRHTIKNGDQFFLRDPETGEWLWIDHFSVEMVKVDDTTGKEPDEYIIRGLDYNKQAKFATGAADPLQYRTPLGTSNVGGSRPVGSGNSSTFSLAGQNSDPRMRQGAMGTQDQLFVVDAQHVVHLSLSSGMDINWPFGESVLEAIFKVFKQKELLEDAIIIYRVQRAPERRIFYIDTGSMPPNRAKAHIEQIKNEIHQRRIPNRTGGGASVLDAAYNPLAVMDDYFIAQGCIRLCEKISLLDGRELPLSEIIKEFEEGKVNYTYSIDLKTQLMEAGEITWAGVTRKNAEMVRITLDNGEHVDVTPDHRFIRRDGTEVLAGDLKPDDSLMPLYRKYGRTGPRQKNAGYTRYTCNKTGKTHFVHSSICPKPKGRDYVVHHIDFNSFNNNPNNLMVMTATDHTEFHKSMGTYSLKKQWSTTEGRAKLLNGIQDYRNSMSNEAILQRQKTCAINGAKTWKNESSAKHSREAFVRNSARANEKRTLVYSKEIYEHVLVVFNNGANSVSKACKFLKQDKKFHELLQAVNRDTLRFNHQKHVKIGTSVTDKTLNNIVSVAGYKSWGDFKHHQSGNFNHKVVSVEFLTERDDTGDITVKSASNSHVFALSCGIYVHNSDGRGSKVETLPGGELVGEIGDLLFFSKKLARGLRIPPLYLFGDDANSMAFNDGKLGTALVQEFLFNKYCMRLQAMLAKTFDYEFKYYLRKTGIEIDENMFELRFCVPQNFSKYRQIELDSQQMQVYSQIADNKHFSERGKKIRYLGMSMDEILEDERMWREENPEKIKKKTGSDGGADASAGLSDVGIRSGAMFPDTGMDADPESFTPDGEMPDGGAPTDGTAPPAAAPVATGGGGDGAGV